MLMLGSTLGSDNFLVWIADDLLVGGTARLGETSMTPSCARTLCLALLLLPLPLAAQAADVNDRTGSNSVSIQPRPTPNAPPVRRGPDPIQKPAEPDKVRGTYELAGEKRSLTEGAFYDTYLVLKPHEDKPQRPLQEQQVLEHTLLFAEAQNM